MESEATVEFLTVEQLDALERTAQQPEWFRYTRGIDCAEELLKLIGEYRKLYAAFLEASGTVK